MHFHKAKTQELGRALPRRVKRNNVLRACFHHFASRWAAQFRHFERVTFTASVDYIDRTMTEVLERIKLGNRWTPNEDQAASGGVRRKSP
ncbi:hypothetical protein MRX96_047676 [Rhipicephalus microplus]